MKKKKKVNKPKNNYALALNAVRGALRLQFRRSDIYKAVWDRNRSEKPRILKSGEFHKVNQVLFTCECCGVSKSKSEKNKTNFEVDHIEPIGKGVLQDLKTVEQFYFRLYDPGNLQLLCTECHKEKTKKDKEAMKMAPELDLEF